jgi:Homing endonuclease associated repeat
MTRRNTSMTKPQMIAAIQECAKKLGRAPSQTEARKLTGITVAMVRRNFGTYNLFLGECQFDGRKHGQKHNTETLLRDWAGVVRKLKKLPSVAVYEHLGNYSETPFGVRFGSWKHLPQGFKAYAAQKGWADEWRDVLEIIDKRTQEDRETAWMFEGTKRPAAAAAAKPAIKEAPLMTDRPVYGQLMCTGPLLFGRTNEDGVIYLFGSLAEELGFIVTRLQGAFPDCEAMRRVVGGKWQPVRIEFEYESRNFVKHGHDAKGCDLIVCWEHNWPECPLEVVELRRVVQELRDRA